LDKSLLRNPDWYRGSLWWALGYLVAMGLCIFLFLRLEWQWLAVSPIIVLCGVIGWARAKDLHEDLQPRWLSISIHVLPALLLLVPYKPIVSMSGALVTYMLLMPQMKRRDERNSN
jgi:membrane protein implicated in regulation of membrane protease activity